MANRPKGYELAANISKMKQEKYSAQADQESREWIEQITGMKMSSKPGPLGPQRFQEALKDGVILCKLIFQYVNRALIRKKLIKAIDPKLSVKINDGSTPFKMMDNITSFLSAAKKYGVKEQDLFQTVDLYEGRNMVQVISAIYSLGRMAQKQGFSGPVLGPKESDSNKRNFTPEQRRASETFIRRQSGTSRGATQSSTSFGKLRDVASLTYTPK